MKYRKSYFIIELPEYKIPSLRFAIGSMLERGKAYVMKAGTVILVCNTVVQIMLVLIVGFAAWQLAAATVTGFIAKENVVGTLATVYALTSFIDTEELELISGGGTVAAVMGLTKAAALAFLMFNLFTPPCFAAIGALNSELRSRKWLVGAILLQLATGFTIGFFVY